LQRRPPASPPARLPPCLAAQPLPCSPPPARRPTAAHEGDAGRLLVARVVVHAHRGVDRACHAVAYGAVRRRHGPRRQARHMLLRRLAERGVRKGLCAGADAGVVKGRARQLLQGLSDLREQAAGVLMTEKGGRGEAQEPGLSGVHRQRPVQVQQRAGQAAGTSIQFPGAASFAGYMAGRQACRQAGVQAGGLAGKVLPRAALTCWCDWCGVQLRPLTCQSWAQRGKGYSAEARRNEAACGGAGAQAQGRPGHRLPQVRRPAGRLQAAGCRHEQAAGAGSGLVASTPPKRA
jgi:hypothetical protein